MALGCVRRLGCERCHQYVARGRRLMREAGRGSNLSVTAHLLTVESRRGGGDAAGLTRTVPAVTHLLPLLLRSARLLWPD